MVVRRWLDKALLAELLLALLLVGYEWFSPYRLVLLLLLASQSLWSRSLGWSDLGLARPPSLWRVVAQGIVGAGVVLRTRGPLSERDVPGLVDESCELMSRLATSSPLMLGIEISSTTASGFRARMASNAAWPSIKVATTSNSSTS